MIRHSCIRDVSCSTQDICLIIISVTAARITKYHIFTGSDLSRRGLLGAFTEIYRIEKNLLFHVKRAEAGRGGWRNARAFEHYILTSLEGFVGKARA